MRCLVVLGGRLINRRAPQTRPPVKSKSSVYSINEEDLKQGGKKDFNKDKGKQSWVYPQDILFGLTF